MARRTDTTPTNTDRPGSPAPVTYIADCHCTVCLAFVSSWAMDRLERDLMDMVAELLDRGWEPEDLVDEIDERSRRGPFAGEIVTLALVSHAGYWLDDLAMADLLVQVDELAACFHHLIGQTGSGWLGRWAHDIDIQLALEGVVDTVEIIPLLQRPCTSRSARGGLVVEAWECHRC